MDENIGKCLAEDTEASSNYMRSEYVCDDFRNVDFSISYHS